MVFGGMKSGAGCLVKCVRSVRDDRHVNDVQSLMSTFLQGQSRGMSRLVEILQDFSEPNKSKKPTAKKPLDIMTLPPPMSFSNYVRVQSQDLRKFLVEVGTDPKEARYWLRQFQRSSEACHPFAVIHVGEDVLENRDMLDSLASSVSFLHRNSMKCVIIHGLNMENEGTIMPETLQDMKMTMTSNSMLLASVLEAHGVHARPMFAGNGIIQAYNCDSGGLKGKICSVNCEPMNWVLMSGHVPIIQSMGETSLGQLVSIDVTEAVMNLSIALQPRKVLIINNRGGLQDEHNDVIANINLPVDSDMEEKSWFTSKVNAKLRWITEMLQQLPQQSSVVITSASAVLAELFTHHGSGTFFKIAEPLFVFTSLEDVNTVELHSLLNRSFGKDLKQNYFDELQSSLDRVFISERYNAAAIIMQVKGLQVAYLDKFAVSSAKQGEGVADDLWHSLKRHYKSLFWRSKASNKINNWYFKKCDGSWSNGKWIVFWYGVSSHSESCKLVDFALSHPSSFQDDHISSKEGHCVINEGKKIN